MNTGRQHFSRFIKISTWGSLHYFKRTLLSLIILGGLAAPLALAVDYNVYYYPHENDWGGGRYTNQDETGTAEANYEAYDGEIRVSASANEPAGLGYAKAWIQKDFWYDDWSCINVLTVDYWHRGLLERIPNGESYYKVYVELYHLPSGGGDPVKLATKVNVNEKCYTGEIGPESRSISFGHLLEQYNEYRVRIIAQTRCEVQVESGGSAYVDFYTTVPSGPDYKVDVSSLNIYHSHTWCSASYGEGTEHEAHDEILFRQDSFEYADKFSLENCNGNQVSIGDLRGWYISFSDLDQAATDVDDNDPNRGHSWARVTSSEDIAKGSHCMVKIWHYFDEEPTCGNALYTENPQWRNANRQRAEQDTVAQAAPNHGWRINHPYLLPGSDNIYTHRFIMSNLEPQEAVVIQGLTFVTTSEAHDTLSVIDFPDSVLYDFTLDPSSPPWELSIETEGPSLGNFIYMTYRIANALADSISCTVWAGHVISMEALPQGVNSDDHSYREPIHLSPIAPNPIAGSLSHSISVPHNAQAALQVFDVEGKLVQTLFKGEIPAGRHDFHWPASRKDQRPLGQGVYYLRLVMNNNLIETRKFIVAR